MATLQGRDAIQGDLDGLERWDIAKLTKFNKTKSKVMPLGWGNPKYNYRLGREQINSSPGEKDLGASMYKKLNISQHVSAAQKANHIVGCITSSRASRSRQVILPLCSGETPPGVLHPALEAPTQERPAAATPEEGCEGDQRAGAPLL
ncbi:rna-directed dna polymerase from mobile element jockey-like [Willisornis vidua]|uniref:Rna-directed dna polymerase from mobile element jockey-like n=1 Tax=Willisornis vidua TaxID=1566151 RepID=A0ABQ9D6R6_9PASS|nr:rna-directed dna polymerase from mobile element jockey-like [Willisornis vidua]